MDLSWVKQASNWTSSLQQYKLPSHRDFAWIQLFIWPWIFELYSSSLFSHSIVFIFYVQLSWLWKLSKGQEREAPDIATITHNEMQSFHMALKLSKKPHGDSSFQGVWLNKKWTKSSAFRRGAGSGWCDGIAVLCPCHCSHLWGSSIHSWTLIEHQVVQPCIYLIFVEIKEDVPLRALLFHSLSVQ